MPTELFDKIGAHLADAGAEFGTVTGRARRCGWFDADLVRFTAQLNGYTGLALTKLDVLDELPVIKICTGYDLDGSDQIHHYWEGDAAWLGRVKPRYIEMEGWQQSTRDARDFSQLPKQARTYVARIEEVTGVPVKFVSVGPDRVETLVR